MRRASTFMSLVMATTLLSGCSVSPCATIGYIADLTVRVSEPREGLQLELCLGAACVPGEDDALGPIAGDGDEGWSVSVVDALDTAGYRVTDETGALVAEGHLLLDWVRVGGTERCGGPAEATLTIDID